MRWRILGRVSGPASERRAVDERKTRTDTTHTGHPHPAAGPVADHPVRARELRANGGPIGATRIPPRVLSPITPFVLASCARTGAPSAPPAAALTLYSLARNLFITFAPYTLSA
jgi:hypothetical protein